MLAICKKAFLKNNFKFFKTNKYVYTKIQMFSSFDPKEFFKEKSKFSKIKKSSEGNFAQEEESISNLLSQLTSNEVLDSEKEIIVQEKYLTVEKRGDIIFLTNYKENPFFKNHKIKSGEILSTGNGRFLLQIVSIKDNLITGMLLSLSNTK
jgi:hypothetical protein